MKLRTRLLYYFVVVSIIPLVLVAFISIRLSFNVLEKKASQFATQTVEQAQYRINQFLETAHMTGEMVASDPTVQEALRRPLDGDVRRKYAQDLKIDSRLDFIQSYMTEEVFGIYVLGLNGGQYKSNYCTFKDTDYHSLPWFRETVNTEEPVWFGTNLGSFAVDTLREHYVSVGLPVIDKASGDRSGIVLMDIQEAFLHDLVKNSRLGDSGYLFVEDQEGRIITHPDRELLGSKSRLRGKTSSRIEVRASLLPLESSERDIVVKRRLRSGWQLVGVFPLKELMSESTRIGFMVMLAVLLVSAVAVVVSLSFSSRIAKPVRALTGLMHRVESGDLEGRITLRQRDEIGELATGFNIMVGKLSNLMRAVYEEQQELMKSRLRVLQSQINPHFLYNTLDSIVWLARNRQHREIISMTTALTKLFRRALSGGDDEIPLREEMEHVESYLTIQRMRYPRKLTYEIDIPSTLYEVRTLKLILQPLVENAIYHGIKNKRTAGKIFITGKEIDGEVELQVRDTGAGMTKERLEDVSRMLRMPDDEESGNVGIRNVNRRLRLYYGKRFGLTFESTSGEGTAVRIRLPKNE